MLREHGVPFIVIDNDAGVVAHARAQGEAVYYGDATSPVFLRRCGIATARAAIITVADRASIDRIVSALRDARDDVVIVARARDAEHARHLYHLGVTDAVPETIEASLQLSEAALVGLGIPTGPVIASIHEQRDIFRRELQAAATASGGSSHGVRSSTRSENR
jgi:CPA2 family monovalent cation:H+ antiporter-2